MAQPDTSHLSEVDTSISGNFLSQCFQQGVCYIVDDTGKRVAVLLDIQEYERMQAQLGFPREEGTHHAAQASSLSGPPIWEAIDIIMAEVPDEALDQLPRDGASHHDRYLYGKDFPGES